MVKRLILSLVALIYLTHSHIWAQKHALPEFNIIPRKAWGWTPPPFTLKPQKIKRITIHHGGILFKKDEDPVKYIRHLQEWSRTEKHWMDIPYHYMIDLDGKIYEARELKYPGDTNTTYNPRGHALICVMGNYEIQKPTQRQIDALAWLCAKLALKYHVPLDSIKAHKDYAETLCPGKNLYRYLQDGSLKKEIKEYELLDQEKTKARNEQSKQSKESNKVK
ncbi:N-acetylmuramoyl-L-alanine amidase [candidate division KSB1 bacterium]|jgi:hypothetical protein|nr:MAG: N-acetylmuramoyl-L-alanine amidase [candidate division KSB1 bacterium]